MSLIEELLAERGVAVDHVTVYRWVQRFTPQFADTARPLRHATGDRWFVDIAVGQAVAQVTADGDRDHVRRQPDPESADRWNCGRPARGRRTHSASLARPDRHRLGSTT
jgi:hypothetical protein